MTYIPLVFVYLASFIVVCHFPRTPIIARHWRVRSSICKSISFPFRVWRVRGEKVTRFRRVRVYFDAYLLFAFNPPTSQPTIHQQNERKAHFHLCICSGAKLFAKSVIDDALSSFASYDMYPSQIRLSASIFANVHTAYGRITHDRRAFTRRDGSGRPTRFEELLS